MLSISRSSVLKLFNKFLLGVNQTWQDVLASRSAGVTYTNTTGKPIVIKIRVVSGTANYYNGQLIVDGKTVSWFGSAATRTDERFTLSSIINNGSTYSFTKGTYGTIQAWYELR